MSTPTSGDLLLVNRGGSNYQIDFDDMSTLQDTDLLLVNRGGVNYQVEAQYVSGANGIIHAPVEVVTPIDNAGITRYALSDSITNVEGPGQLVVQTDQITSVTPFGGWVGENAPTIITNSLGNTYTDSEISKLLDSDTSTSWTLSGGYTPGTITGTVTFTPALEVAEKARIYMPGGISSSPGLTPVYGYNGNATQNGSQHSAAWYDLIDGPGQLDSVTSGRYTSYAYGWGGGTAYAIEVDGQLISNDNQFDLQFASANNLSGFSTGQRILASTDVALDTGSNALNTTYPEYAFNGDSNTAATLVDSNSTLPFLSSTDVSDLEFDIENSSDSSVIVNLNDQANSAVEYGYWIVPDNLGITHTNYSVTIPAGVRAKLHFHVDFAEAGYTLRTNNEIKVYSISGTLARVVAVDLNQGILTVRGGTWNVGDTLPTVYNYDTKLTLAGDRDISELVGAVKGTDGVANSNGTFAQTPYTLTSGNITHVNLVLEDAMFSTNQGTASIDDWEVVFDGYTTGMSPMGDGQWRQINFIPPLPKGAKFEMHCGNTDGGAKGIVINGTEVGNLAPVSADASTDEWFDWTSHINETSISSIRVEFNSGVEYGRVNSIRIDDHIVIKSDIFLTFDSNSPDIQYLENGDLLQEKTYWNKADWSGTNLTSASHTDGVNPANIFDGNVNTSYSPNVWSSGMELYFTGMPTGEVGDYTIKTQGSMWWDGGANTLRGVSVTVYTTEGSTSYSGGSYGNPNWSNPLPLPIGGQLTRISSGRSYPYRSDIGVYVAYIAFQGKLLVDASVVDDEVQFIREGSDSNVVLVNDGNWYSNPASYGDGTLHSHSNNPPLNKDQDWSSTTTVTTGTVNSSYPVSNMFDGKIAGRQNGFISSSTAFYQTGSGTTTVMFANPVPFESSVHVAGYSFSDAQMSSGQLIIVDSGGAGGTSREVILTSAETISSGSMSTLKDFDVTDLLVSPILGIGIIRGATAYWQGLLVDGKLLVDPDVYDTGGTLESQLTFETSGGTGTILSKDPSTNSIYLEDSNDDNARWIIGTQDILNQPGNSGETGNPANAIDFYLSQTGAILSEAEVSPTLATFTSQNAGTSALTADSDTEVSSRTWTLEFSDSADGPWTLVGTYEDLDMNASQDGSTPWSGRPTLSPNTYYRVKVAYNSTNVELPVESTYNIFKTGA